MAITVCWGRVWSQVGCSWALRVRPELPLFLLSVCFALSLHWTVAPELGGAEGRGGGNPCRHLDCVGCRQRSELSLTCYLRRCHCFYFLCSDAASDQSLLLSPTADYSTHLPLTLSWMEGTLGSHEFSACIRAWSGMELPSSEFWAASDAWGSASDGHCCPIQALPQDWVTSVSRAPIFSPVVAAQDPVLPGLCLGVCRPGVFVWLGLAAYQGGHRKPLCLSCGQTSTCVLLMSRVEASHWPFASPTGPPSSQEDLSLPSRTLGLEHPVCGSHHSLARVGLRLCMLPLPFRLLPESQVLARSLFSPFYPITHGSFLQPWLYRSRLSASFQLIIGENCFTCRRIFSTFIGGDEFHWSNSS